MKNNTHKIWMIAGIISVLFVGIPITAAAMSARPPAISEQIEADGYLQKSYTDSRKTLIHDKNGKVVGYARESYLDSRKTVVYDTNDTVKGYLQQDLMDSRKILFYRE